MGNTEEIKKVSFYDGIHGAIRAFTIGTGGHYPNIIIVHPNTWYELCEELLEHGSDFHRYIREMNNLQFCGYPVYRSNDVTEGDFVIY